jgi:histidinol-phosphate aminotransferase
VSTVPPVRPDLALSEGYHSPQVDAEVRLNTNESPFAPPEAWRDELLAGLAEISFHRYPDRPATELRQAVADLHGVTPDEVFCANGSNEVLQSVLLAFGGPGRRALVFEPTYALHSHISRITGTEVIEGARDDDFLIDPQHALELLAARRPDVTFLCSPNNPTGRAEPPETVAAVSGAAPGLVIVDEAYGQFAPWSALALRGPTHPGLVVTRTFSKTWAMAGSATR